MTTRALFPTLVYEADLAERRGGEDLNTALEASIHALARDDGAGRAWCRAHGYGGYTSYASLDDLPRRDPAFAELKRRLEREVSHFATDLDLDLGGRRLKLDSLWVNLLKPGAGHSGHIHPHSAISGTYYVSTPPGASALKLEDPRLPLMMAAPPRRADAPEEARAFVYLQPQAGTLYLWESWLRHEVPLNTARAPRLSVSFNYAWA